ncbi:MAG: SDR family oxidoreductase [Bacteroidales bacterium]|nr:SDR family oxidoreductase [Bacteroidales bacterium]
MKKKSILIGSNGYLGKHLAFFLEQEGFENANFDIHPQAATGIRNYKKIDITNENDFFELNPDIDFIFFFAGLTGTSAGFDDYKKFISVNEIGLLNLLNWMRKITCKARIIFPSTRLVYKGVKNTPLLEESPKETKTIYAANKLNAENLLWMYHNAFDIDFTVFRICVPYGNLFDARFSYGTLGFFLSKAQNGDDITLYGDGLIGRTFTHVLDISDAIVRAIQNEKTKNGIFNIGGENLTLLEVAKLVAEKFGVGIQFTDWPAMPLKLESGDTIFEDTRLRSVISLPYRHSIAQWIKDF